MQNLVIFQVFSNIMQFFFHVSDDATDACERVYISIFRTNVNI